LQLKIPLIPRDEKGPHVVVRRTGFKGEKKLCPNCLHELEQWNPLGGWLIPAEFSCPICNYEGHLAIESRSAPSVGNHTRHQP
jgi:hypothetical protein